MHRLLNLILLTATIVVTWRIHTTWSAVEPTRGMLPEERELRTITLPDTARAASTPRLAETIAERTLFDRSRRAPTTAPPEAAALPPADLELVGILMTGSQAEALIKNVAGQGELRHVLEGDEIGGHIVSAISPTKVTLTAPGGVEVPLPLSLERSRTVDGKKQRGKLARRKQKRTRPTAAGPVLSSSAKSPRTRKPSNLRQRLQKLRQQRQARAKRSKR